MSAFDFEAFDDGAFDAAPTVTEIAITTPSLNVQGGTSVQFTATATYADDTSADVTNQVTWASSDPSVVSIAQDGTAQIGFAKGTATITADLP